MTPAEATSGGRFLVPIGDPFDLGTVICRCDRFALADPSAICVNESGRYKVHYMTSFAVPEDNGSHRSIGLRVCDNLQTAYAVGSIFSEAPSASPFAPVWGKCIVNLDAGDRLSIVNLSSAPALVNYNTGAFSRTQTFISIKRVRCPPVIPVC